MINYEDKYKRWSLLSVSLFFSVFPAVINKWLGLIINTDNYLKLSIILSIAPLLTLAGLLFEGLNDEKIKKITNEINEIELNKKLQQKVEKSKIIAQKKQQEEALKREEQAILDIPIIEENRQLSRQIQELRARLDFLSRQHSRNKADIKKTVENIRRIKEFYLDENKETYNRVSPRERHMHDPVWRINPYE